MRLGKPDPGPTALPLGPIFTHVTREPDKDWDRIAPHVLHCVESYGEWTIEAYGRASGPFAAGIDVAQLRESGAYQVCTSEAAVEMIRGLGVDRTFILTPLLGGLDPAFAWDGLKLFETDRLMTGGMVSRAIARMAPTT